MAITIKTAPTTTRSDSTVCYMNAAYNNVYIDLQRQDTQITALARYSPLKFKLNVADASIFAVDATAYVEVLLDGILEFAGTYDILAVDAVNNFIVIDKAWYSTSGTVTGFANTSLRLQHKVFVKITVDAVISIAAAYHTDSAGVARVYLKSLLQKYFDNTLDADYTAVNKKLDGKDFEFYCSYKEEYYGYYTDLYHKLPAVWKAVKAVQQIGDDLRMVDYEIYYYGLGVYSTAKFLTAFVEPVYFENYPFAIGALFGPSTVNIDREVTYHDGSTTVTALDMAEADGVNTITLTSSVSSPHCWLALKVGTGDNEYINDYILNYIDDYYSTT